MHGRLLFEDDAARRVEWEATTRKIYLDERFRARQFVADVTAALKRRRDG